MLWRLAFLCSLIPSAVLANLQCGGSITLTPDNPSYQFSSRNPHPSPVDCEWNIAAPSKPLTVSCPVIDCECRKAYFGIYINGTLSQYCGKTSFSKTVQSNTVKLTFVSSSPKNTKYRGYECTVSYTSTTPVTNLPPIYADALGTCKCGKRLYISTNATRIVGGVVTEANEFPWQAMLMYKKNDGTLSHYCGGSLIHPKWVLTAAHCTDPFVASGITVRLGEHDKTVTSGNEKDFAVTRIIQHANFNDITIDNDISLLELGGSAPDIPQISPVCLPFNQQNLSLSGKIGTVTGWGTTQEGGSTSNLLMKVDIPFKTTEECKVYMPSEITNNMICTYEAGKDSCQGDSGGPLVWQNSSGNNFLMGIVSWGYGCAEVNKPGVYTKVTNYLDWIRTKTGLGNEFCIL